MTDPLSKTIAHLFADEAARARSDGATLAYVPTAEKAEKLCEAIGEGAKYE